MPFTSTPTEHIRVTITIHLQVPAKVLLLNKMKIFCAKFFKFHSVECSTNCFSCSQDNSAYCTECIYSKVRYSSLTTFYTSLATSAMDCSALSSRSGTATLTYYLRPKGTACTSTPCANTMNLYSTYYDSFYDIMTDVFFFF